MLNKVEVDAIVQEIARHQRLLMQVDDVAHIPTGRSEDVSYQLSSDGNPAYLLKISDSANVATRKRQFEAQSDAHSVCSLVQQPLAFGTTIDGRHCYSLFEFIPGDNGVDVLSTLNREAQQKIGRAAGRALRQIHDIQERNVSNTAQERLRAYRKAMTRLGGSRRPTGQLAIVSKVGR